MANQSLQKICSHIASLLLLSLILSASARAQPNDPSWIHSQDPKIGQWHSGQLKMNLKASGQVTLIQSAVSLKALDDQGFTTSSTVLYGYWWSDSDQLCLNFDLHSRCLSYKVSTKNQIFTLSIQIGREWVKLIKTHQTR